MHSIRNENEASVPEFSTWTFYIFYIKHYFFEWREQLSIIILLMKDLLYTKLKEKYKLLAMHFME